MEKVFEALEIISRALEFNDEGEFQSGRLWRIIFNDMVDDKEKSIIEQAMAELKTIKEANPSEAMKHLEELEKVIEEITISNVDLKNTLKTSVLITSIKQALQQRITWKHIHNTEVRVPWMQVIRGKTREEQYQIIEDIYYNWEEKKEALEDKNQALEDKNKELEYKNKKLEKENAEYKKLFEFIKEKSVESTQIVKLHKYLDFLDLFITLHNRAYIYDEEGNLLKILQVLNTDTIVVRKHRGEKIFLPIKDYKQKFWLKKDKSE